MTLDVDRRVTAAAWSVFKYLHDVEYTVEGADQMRLYQRFTVTTSEGTKGLQFEQAYPDDITALKVPTLAVTSPQEITDGDIYFGEGITEDQMTVELYGFVLAVGKQRATVLFRDRLVNDLRALLRSGTVIPLYDQPTKLPIGEIEVVRSSVRVLQASAPDIDADRFKFRGDLLLEYA